MSQWFCNRLYQGIEESAYKPHHKWQAFPAHQEPCQWILGNWELIVSEVNLQFDWQNLPVNLGLPPQVSL